MFEVLREIDVSIGTVPDYIKVKAAIVQDTSCEALQIQIIEQPVVSSGEIRIHSKHFNAESFSKKKQDWLAYLFASAMVDSIRIARIGYKQDLKIVQNQLNILSGHVN